MKKLLTFLTLLTLFFTTGWAAAVTLSNANIVAAGTGAGGYSNWTLTDGNNNTWHAFAIKNQHSNATSDYHFLQIKKYASNTAYYIQVPELGSKITQISMVVSNTSSSMSGGGNSVTLFFSASNSTASTGTGVASGTGASSVTIDCSSLNLNTGYITASGAVRIWQVEVTYEEGGTTPTLFDIIYGTPSNGTISGPASAAENTQVELSANPNPGYQFGSWNVTDANNTIINVVNNIFTMPAANVNVNATFTALPKYNISVTNGAATDGTEVITKAYVGQTVTLTPTIPSGNVVDWDNTTVTPSTLEINHSDYTFTMPGEDVTVTFAFKDAPHESTATLTNANIVAAGDGQTGYQDWTLTDANGKTWNAHAIKNQHSNATSNYHYLQLKKSTNSEPSFIQVPEYGTKITKLVMTVSSANQPMTGGGNTATLFFSSSNSTTSTGTGVASGTGASSITIDCSNLDLNTGYITTSAGIRIWDVTVFYEEDNPVQVDDLYIVGQVNGNDEDPFDPNEGVKLTYSQTNDTYSGDFYCTGMNGGYSYFLFSKKVPYSFDNASDLYGSGASNSFWAISEDGANESHFGDVIPLYAGLTNSFRLPAGLYNVTVDLSDVPNLNNTDKSIVVTKRAVTMNITPSYAYFDDTYEISMSSNLTDIGGEIYYTTDGGNPSDPNSSRQEYTGPITISATTTFKAVAFVGNLYSAIAEKTFTKTPKTPVITPNGGTITEATPVEITCETEGASIYYTLDGSTPTNVVSETNFLYSGAFTISETTTVKARAYVGDTYSNGIATAEFVYTEPIAPGTGDFVRVTSKDDLVAGREYIIVTADYNWAMGAISTDDKRAAASQDFTISTDHSTVTLTENSTVNVMKLEDGRVYPSDDTKYWNLKQENGQYVYLNNSGTQISQSAQTYLSGYSKELIINITAGTNENNYAIITEGGNSQILYSKGSNNTAGYFRYYSNTNQNNSAYSRVFLYYRDAVKIKSLAEIEANGSINTKYAISDEYLVAVEAREVKIDEEHSDVYVWCKDDNNVTNKLTPAEGVIDFMKQQGEVGMPSTQPWDQSNWVVLRFKDGGLDEKNLKGNKVTAIVGTYVDATNYMIDVESYTKGEAESYTPNVYCVANFNPANWGPAGVQQKNDEDEAYGDFYFFMTPKVQEVCHITFAEWTGSTGSTFTVPAKSGFAKNTLTLGWDYNQDEAGTPVNQTTTLSTLINYLNENNVVDPQTGKLPAYEFDAIVQATGSKGAITGGSKVYPTNLTGSSNVVTAISTVNVGNGDVKSVKYVNVAGIVSDRPFQGVNIVVTEYTDGSRTTSKMLKK